MKRYIEQISKGLATTDGAGVELVRVIGQPSLMELDPFLMLDAFRSDNPDDYIAGFPPHPHRGFETVTYLLNGRMRHKDNAGHEGVIEAGGIQWMTAGRGIVHSEMPEQEDGLLQGFQLWINLPAAHKMDEPAYQEFDVAQIPVESREGTHIKVVAGSTSLGTRGVVVQPLTQPVYLDVALQASTPFNEIVDTSHNAFLYGIEGQLELQDRHGETQVITRDQLAVLSSGEEIEAIAGNGGARFLLIAGKPIGEPIARGGPFVMNTRDEIDLAFADYRAGRF